MRVLHRPLTKEEIFLLGRIVKEARKHGKDPLKEKFNLVECRKWNMYTTRFDVYFCRMRELAFLGYVTEDFLQGGVTEDLVFSLRSKSVLLADIEWAINRAKIQRRRARAEVKYHERGDKAKVEGTEAKVKRLEAMVQEVYEGKEEEVQKEFDEKFRQDIM